MKTLQIMKLNNEPLSDKELLSNVINGQFDSFDVIVNRYKNRLLNFVFRFVKDYDVAEDIVQETFLRVFRKRRDYKAIANFSTWIFTIAGNLAKSELRRRKRWKFLSLDAYSDSEKNFELPDSGMKPDRATAVRLLDEHVQKAIDSLQVKYKEALILRDVEGLSYQQISEIMNIPVGTVKSRVNRARLKLRKVLKEHSPSDELFH
ncbi:MAG: sigma-70 family RNA polymerase sigma factor [Candidatus Latescibacteria bacterium]|jgi:RNA polymerase sigma-70 factor, ECF subfamily|nr:sigma-70 family RNA polymerase sigma factor [Candidatus Latescibacterota bacterium]